MKSNRTREVLRIAAIALNGAYALAVPAFVIGLALSGDVVSTLMVAGFELIPIVSLAAILWPPARISLRV